MDAKGAETRREQSKRQICCAGHRSYRKSAKEHRSSVSRPCPVAQEQEATSRIASLEPAFIKGRSRPPASATGAKTFPVVAALTLLDASERYARMQDNGRKDFFPCRVGASGIRDIPCLPQERNSRRNVLQGRKRRERENGQPNALSYCPTPGLIFANWPNFSY